MDGPSGVQRFWQNCSPNRTQPVGHLRIVEQFSAENRSPGSCDGRQSKAKYMPMRLHSQPSNTLIILFPQTCAPASSEHASTHIDQRSLHGMSRLCDLLTHCMKLIANPIIPEIYKKPACVFRRRTEVQRHACTNRSKLMGQEDCTWLPSCCPANAVACGGSCDPTMPFISAATPR